MPNNPHTRGAQFELSPEMTKIVDKLKPKIKASTRAEVVRRSLSYLDALLEETAKGGQIEIVYKDGTRMKVKVAI